MAPRLSHFQVPQGLGASAAAQPWHAHLRIGAPSYLQMASQGHQRVLKRQRAWLVAPMQTPCSRTSFLVGAACDTGSTIHLGTPGNSESRRKHPGNEIAHLDEQRDLPNCHGGGTTLNGLTYPRHRWTRRRVEHQRPNLEQRR